MTTYLLAKDLSDAREWARFNGLACHEWTYLGQSWHIPRRIIAETDRVVRTARSQEHPAAAELERHLAEALDYHRLTETQHGALVRRGA